MNISWFVVTKDIGQMSSWKDMYAPTFKLLESSQLLEMQDAGVETGSHAGGREFLSNLVLSMRLSKSILLVSQERSKKYSNLTNEILHLFLKKGRLAANLMREQFPF